MGKPWALIKNDQTYVEIFPLNIPNKSNTSYLKSGHDVIQSLTFVILKVLNVMFK